MSNKIVGNLLLWHKENERELPWKSYTDAYTIWLSEIIMQQTRVDQGTVYFLRFKKKFPTIRDLAKANLATVLKLWEGLGYYSRARNLHFTAKYVVKELGGVFPNNYDALIKLKGIGPYSAAAIASFSNNEAVAVVDGNVNRVISRLMGIHEPIDTTQGKKLIRQVANQLLPKDKAGEFNQAIMNFGALVCKPRGALCSSCPLQNQCLAYKEDIVSILPIKNKKQRSRPRYFLFFLLVDENGRIMIEERIHKDVWQNLYQLPMIELENTNQFNNRRSHFVGFEGRLLDDTLIQQLSHQKINARFVQASIHSAQKKKEWKAVSSEEITKFTFPKILNDFLNLYYLRIKDIQ